MNIIDIGLLLSFLLAALALFLALRKPPVTIIPNFGIKLPDGVLCMGCEIIYSHHLDVCPYCGEKEKFKLSNSVRPLLGRIKEVKYGLSSDQRDVFKVPPTVLDPRTLSDSAQYMGYIALDHFYPFPNWRTIPRSREPIVIGIDPEVFKPSWTIALYNQCREFRTYISGIIPKSIRLDAGKAGDMGKDPDQKGDNKTPG